MLKIPLALGLISLSLLLCGCSTFNLGADNTSPVELIATATSYVHQADQVFNATLNDFSMDIGLSERLSDTPDGIEVPDKVRGKTNTTILFNISIQNREEYDQNYTLTLGEHTNVYRYPQLISIRAVRVRTIPIIVWLNSSETLHLTLADADHTYAKDIPIIATPADS